MSSFEEQENALLRQRIVRLEEQVDLLYRHLGIARPGESAAPDDPQLVAALRAHQMIEAIKIYRQKTNAGLAEAKAACEAIQARLGI